MRPGNRNTLISLALMLLIAAPVFVCPACSDAAEGAPTKSITVVSEIAHDSSNFTQGLLFHDGLLYEGTGQYKQSRVIRMDPKTGKTLKDVKLHDSLFGEGICIFGDKIIQLTWKKGKAIVFDLKSFRRKGQLKYDGEGWGLTTDGTDAIMSNGTDEIAFRDPETFEIKKTIKVTDGDEKIRELNELEFIDGNIWANVWQQERIACINPADGKIRYWIDCKGLKDRLGNPLTSGNFNGIAYDEQTKKIWVTGKNWDKMFEIKVD